MNIEIVGMSEIRAHCVQFFEKFLKTMECAQVQRDSFDRENARIIVENDPKIVIKANEAIIRSVIRNSDSDAKITVSYNFFDQVCGVFMWEYFQKIRPTLPKEYRKVIFY
jgi:hypothetical protein